MTVKKDPFIFYSRLNLSELTGVKAATLSQLLKNIKSMSLACIYHHTHRYLQLHQYLCPEPPNDFAYWVNNVVKEEELAEKLASIDIIRFPSLIDLRDLIVKIIADYLEKNPKAKFKFVNPGQEFYFIKSISFIFSSRHKAADLKEFMEGLKSVTVGSIYFHMFEARIRLEKGNNDFSFWLEHSLGEKELAQKISSIDPYSFTVEGLRSKLVSLIDRG
jgi:hypothetical protein